jgi:hypothetical protein
MKRRLLHILLASVLSNSVSLSEAQNTSFLFSYKNLNEIIRQGKTEYLDQLSVMTSFWGNYVKAIRFHDLSEGIKDPNYPRLVTKGYSPKPFMDALDKISENQIIFISEAHHLPASRIATICMLKKMYEKGFRYLACEGIDVDSTINRNKRVEFTDLSYPETLFTEMLRQAITLGYHIVAYDGSCIPSGDTTGMIDANCRERLQAQTLYDKVLKNNPKAKMIVHGGYGHIYKEGNSEWNPMGKYFMEITGITPYCINQVTVVQEDSASLVKFFSANHLPVDKPVFLSKGDTLFSVRGTKNACYDADLFLSREFIANKSEVMRCLPKRKAVDMSKLCKGFQKPFLLEATLKSEGDKAVAFDALEIETGTKPVLYLEKGRYIIKLISTKGLVLSSREYTVPD